MYGIDQNRGGGAGGRRELAGLGVADRVQSRDWMLRKCVPVNGMPFGSPVGFGMECYSVGMRIHPGSSLEQAVRADRNEAMDRATIEKHIIAIAPRANFVRAYIARGGRDANGRRLDPVLAAHLGLERTE